MAEDGTALTETPPDGEQSEGPHAFLEGSFAMYATPDGGIMLATYTTLMGDQTVRVPKILVKQAARSNPALAEILRAAR